MVACRYKMPCMQVLPCIHSLEGMEQGMLLPLPEQAAGGKLKSAWQALNLPMKRQSQL